MNRLAALTLLATIALASSVHAFPISPVHLWALSEEADVIFLAEVESVARDDGQRLGGLGDARSATFVRTESRRPSVARLAVTETWKGTPHVAVDVPFNSGLICPDPPSFTKGETVAVFLTREETGWQVVALSYGVRHLEPDDIAVLRDRTREALALQVRAPVTNALRVEWLVACCQHPSTREEALRELAPRVHRDDAAYDRTRRPDFGSLLSREQGASIAQACIDAPPSLVEIPVVAFFLRHEPSAALTRTLREVVERALADPSLRWALPDAMTAVATRLGVADAARRFTQLDSLEAGEYPSLSQFKLEWDEAMASTAP